LLSAGRPSDSTRALIARLNSIQLQIADLEGEETAISRAIARLSRNVVAARINALPADSVTKLERDIEGKMDTVRALQESVKTIAVLSEELAREIGKQAALPSGTRVEVAAAAVAAYPTQAFDGGKISQVGLWLTASRAVSGSGNDLIAVARYMYDTQAETHAVDLGARFVWQLGDLALSGEFLNRANLQRIDASGLDSSAVAFSVASSTRSALIAEYRLVDGTHLTFSFGKDLRPVGATRAPLLLTIGLQLLGGAKPMVKAQ
jgi:hypothetical protein